MPKKKKAPETPQKALKNETRTALVNLGDMSVSILIDPVNNTVTGIVSKGSVSYSFNTNLKEL